MKRRAILYGLLMLLVASATAALPQQPSYETAELVAEVRRWLEDGNRPVWSATGERVAFDRLDELGYSRLYIAEADGSRARCLTCRPLEFRKMHTANAAWHPSGKILVFQVERPVTRAGFPLPFRTVPGGNRGGEDIWAISSDGKAFWNLTHRGDEGARFGAPRFSREGDQLLWSERIASGGGAWGRWALRVGRFQIKRGIPRLSKVRTWEPGPQRLYAESGDFTADDLGIVFAANLELDQLESGLDLYELRLEDGHVRRVTSSREELDRFPRLAPNGRWIAWVSNRGIPREAERYQRRGSPAARISDLWLMAIDGRAEQRLTHFSDVFSDRYLGKMIAGPPAWSPSGDRILVPVAPLDEPQRSGIYEVRLLSPIGK